MKKIAIATAILSASVFIFGIGTSFAADSSNMWTCKTNASSAPSGSAEAQADKDMKDNGKAMAQALATAAQHCRDCTKITCSKS